MGSHTTGLHWTKLLLRVCLMPSIYTEPQCLLHMRLLTVPCIYLLICLCILRQDLAMKPKMTSHLWLPRFSHLNVGMCYHTQLLLHFLASGNYGKFYRIKLWTPGRNRGRYLDRTPPSFMSCADIADMKYVGQISITVKRRKGLIWAQAFRHVGPCRIGSTAF